MTHGVPAHNPFLHLFEADKDLVYLDYSAVTIVEKALITYNRATPQSSNISDVIRTAEDNEDNENKQRESIAIEPASGSASQNSQGVKDAAGMAGSWNWEVR